MNIPVAGAAAVALEIVGGAGGRNAGVEDSGRRVRAVLVLSQVVVTAAHNVNTWGFNGGGCCWEHRDSKKNKPSNKSCGY